MHVAKPVVALGLRAVRADSTAGHEEGRRAEELRVREDQVPSPQNFSSKCRLGDGTELLQLTNEHARRGDVAGTGSLATRTGSRYSEELALQSDATVQIGVQITRLRGIRQRRLWLL